MNKTADLWACQDRHEGDRERLFRAVGSSVDAERVLYPGCYVDLAPSFVWPSVTYVDTDRRAASFFADSEGLLEIIARHPPAPANPEIDFRGSDYTGDLELEPDGFDLLVSLYAGPISKHCTRYLRVGGVLLVNPSHGDAALASIDDRYELAGVVRSRSGDYSVERSDLDSHLVPKKTVDVAEAVARTGRGIAYTKSPFAYLFRRIA